MHTKNLTFESLHAILAYKKKTDKSIGPLSHVHDTVCVRYVVAVHAGWQGKDRVTKIGKFTSSCAFSLSCCVHICDQILENHPYGHI